MDIIKAKVLCNLNPDFQSDGPNRSVFFNGSKHHKPS